MPSFSSFFLHASDEEKIKVFTEAANLANQEQRRIMYTGISELFYNRATYCALKVLYDECKWWKFARKRDIKNQMNWIYPMMRNEVKSMNKDDI